MLNSLHPVSPLALSMPMGAEWLVIAALGLLIFGKRLPDVGKGLGSAIRSFKDGLSGIGSEVEAVAEAPSSARLTNEPHKFDPHTGKPIEQPKFDPYTGKP